VDLWGEIGWRRGRGDPSAIDRGIVTISTLSLLNDLLCFFYSTLHAGSKAEY
jgi:hypothetical protein